MPHSPALVKQEPGPVSIDEFRPSDRKPRRARLRSRSVFSSTSENLNLHDGDESDAEANDDANGYSSSEETYSKEHILRRTARFHAATPHDDEEERKPFVKLEDHPISDDYQRLSPLLSSPAPTPEASWSRPGTPTPTIITTPRHAARLNHARSDMRLQLRRQRLAAAFPYSNLSRPNHGESRRLDRRSTSALVDDKLRVFLKQEILDSEVDSLDYGDASNQVVVHSNAREVIPRGPTPATASRANNEEDEQPGPWTEFYASLGVIRSLAELIVASAGARPRHGSVSKPFDIHQAENLDRHFTTIESSARRLRQILSSHFSGIVNVDKPPADSSYAAFDNASCQSPPGTPAIDAPPVNNTVAPMEFDPTLPLVQYDESEVLNFDWHDDLSQVIDGGLFDTDWNLTQGPSQTMLHGAGGWGASYDQSLLQPPSNLTHGTAVSIPPITAAGLAQLAPMMPIQPTTVVDPSPTFVTRDTTSTNSAMYYPTIGSFQVSTTTGQPTGALLNPTGLLMPNHALVPPDSCEPSDFDANMDVVEEFQSPLWQQFFQLGDSIPENMSDPSPDSWLPTKPSSNTGSCGDPPSLPPPEPSTFATNRNTTHQPAPDPISDDTPRIPCTYEGCNKTFRRPYLLRDHMRSHTGESNAYLCKHEGCTKSFGSQSNLTRHYKTHKPDKGMPNNQDRNNAEINRLVTPTPNAPLALLAATPRRSQRLQNAAPNPLGSQAPTGLQNVAA